MAPKHSYKRIQIGERSFRLVVLKRIGKRASSISPTWECRCDCGQVVIRESYQVREMGQCEDCSRVIRRENRVTHGHARVGKYHPLYGTWRAMLNRCLNPNNPNYKYYGRRGIRVCVAWKDFEQFRCWAEANGWKKKLTLDRIDPDKDYCPENCEYVTQAENSRRARAGYMWVRRRHDPWAFASYLPIEALFGSA